MEASQVLEEVVLLVVRCPRCHNERWVEAYLHRLSCHCVHTGGSGYIQAFYYLFENYFVSTLFERLLNYSRGLRVFFLFAGLRVFHLISIVIKIVGLSFIKLKSIFWNIAYYSSYCLIRPNVIKIELNLTVHFYFIYFSIFSLPFNFIFYRCSC